MTDVGSPIRAIAEPGTVSCTSRSVANNCSSPADWTCGSSTEIVTTSSPAVHATVGGLMSRLASAAVWPWLMLPLLLLLPPPPPPPPSFSSSSLLLLLLLPSSLLSSLPSVSSLRSSPLRLLLSSSVLALGVAVARSAGEPSLDAAALTLRSKSCHHVSSSTAAAERCAATPVSASSASSTPPAYDAQASSSPTPALPSASLLGAGCRVCCWLLRFFGSQAGAGAGRSQAGKAPPAIGFISNWYAGCLNTFPPSAVHNTSAGHLLQRSSSSAFRSELQLTTHRPPLSGCCGTRLNSPLALSLNSPRQSLCTQVNGASSPPDAAPPRRCRPPPARWALNTEAPPSLAALAARPLEPPPRPFFRVFLGAIPPHFFMSTACVRTAGAAMSVRAPVLLEPY